MKILINKLFLNIILIIINIYCKIKYLFIKNGDWGLGIGPNPQSPIPNPQSPIPNPQLK